MHKYNISIRNSSAKSPKTFSYGEELLKVTNIDIFVGIREASDDFSLNFADDCGRINSLMENS
jgi:hypothetical protein